MQPVLQHTGHHASLAVDIKDPPIRFEKHGELCGVIRVVVRDVDGGGDRADGGDAARNHAEAHIGDEERFAVYTQHEGRGALLGVHGRCTSPSAQDDDVDACCHRYMSRG